MVLLELTYKTFEGNRKTTAINPEDVQRIEPGPSADECKVFFRTDKYGSMIILISYKRMVEKWNSAMNTKVQ